MADWYRMARAYMGLVALATAWVDTQFAMVIALVYIGMCINNCAKVAEKHE